MKFLGIHLFFSNLILPSIALISWNFPDNLDFKGMILAKFLLRSHFLSICNNMTVKQHINHGAIQKVYHLHNSIFHSINLCHTFFRALLLGSFLSLFLSTPSLSSTPILRREKILLQKMAPTPLSPLPCCPPVSTALVNVI